MAGPVLERVHIGQVQPRGPGEELFQRDARFESCEVIARAEMDAVLEGQVGPEVRAAEIDDVGIIEDLGIAVG